MSLLNRLQVSNVLNIEGEAENLPWNPRLRDVVLPFHGQSTAAVMDNGTGKTTLSEALIALLTRDRHLTMRTRRKMAPERSGTRSHVRIELIDPGAQAGNTDLLVAAGGESPGETWVFGMSGFRGDQQHLDFYFYRGRFEDWPLSAREGGRLTLIPWRESLKSRADVTGMKWGLSPDEWREELSKHVDLASMDQLATFQKAGASDKSAALFDVTPARGEPFNVAFFYHTLAPQILSDLMSGPDASEGEKTFEDTIYESVVKILEAQKSVEQEKARTENAKAATKVFEDLAELGEDAVAKNGSYKDRLQQVALHVAALRRITKEEPLPGIPRVDLPAGEEGEVARHLVVVPGKGLHLRDNALARLSQREVKEVNRVAARNQIFGVAESQVVEIPSHLKWESPGHGGRRHPPKLYSLKQVRELLPAVMGSRAGLTADTAWELVEDARDWFWQKADSNPARAALTEAEDQLAFIESQLDNLRTTRVDLQAKLSDLAKARERLDADRALFEDVRQSGQFDANELENPVATLAALPEEQKGAARALQSFVVRADRIGRLQPSWEAFTAAYGEATDPHVTERFLEDEQERIGERLKEIRQELTALQGRQRELALEERTVSGDLTRANLLGEQFDSLAGGVERYREVFGTENPEGLGNQVLEDRTKLRRGLEETGERIDALGLQVTRLQRYREQHGNLPPSDLKERRNIERRQLDSKLSQSTDELQDLRRRRAVLEENPIAPLSNAHQAAESLRRAGVAFEPLYTYLQALDLPSGQAADAFTHFSALLFTPVLDDPEAGVAAARVLHEEGREFPVFSGPALTAYVLSGAVGSLPAFTGAEGLLYGTRTRAVECLLDPGLVEREKLELDAAIVLADQACKELEARLLELQQESESSRLISDAERALADGAEAALIDAQTHLNGLQAQVARVELRASATSLEAIRDQQAFTRLGGEAGLASNREQIELLKGRLGEVREYLEGAEQQKQDLESEEREQKEAHDKVYPADVRKMLDGAKNYHDEEGSTFTAAAPQVESRLKEAVDRAHTRAEYKSHLEAAGRVLATRAQEAIGETVEDAIEKLEQRLTENGAELTSLDKSAKEQKALLPGLSARVLDCDEVVASLQAVLEKVLPFATDVDRIAVDQSGLAAHPISMEADAFRDAVLGEDAEALRASAYRFREVLETPEYSEHGEALARARSDTKSTLSAFLSRIRSCVDDEESALTPTERSMLGAATGIEVVGEVVRGARRLREEHESLSHEYEAAQASATRSRELARARLTGIIARARDNLHAMKVVAGNKYGGDAWFEVEAEVANDEALSTLVDDLIKVVDVARKSEQERAQTTGLPSDPEQSVAGIKELIRQSSYRRIFLKVAVKFVNPAIRPNRKAHLLNVEHLSVGQRTATSLMWVVRLAQFAVQREALQIRNPTYRRRRLASKETIVIIDGLFSDLSRKELIDSAVSGIATTRGKLQIVGLIHNPHYVNNPDMFPVLLVGKEHGDGWVSIDEEGAVVDEPEKSLGVAEMRTERRAATEAPVGAE